MVSLNTRKFLDTDPYSGPLISRLTTSLSSDTGTIVGSTADTLTGKLVLHVIFHGQSTLLTAESIVRDHLSKNTYDFLRHHLATQLFSILLPQS